MNAPPLLPDEAAGTPATDALHDAFIGLRDALSARIVGQSALVERLLVALLADGHLLVEGAPGLAKTTAIRALAARLEADFARVQFTPDLLPADLTGTEIWRPQEGRFEFVPGPIFHPILLADEINRAPAKVQSALLEAMGERQVTVGRHTYALPSLFLVMATQNPIEQEGTYRLPEAQMDRFMLKDVLDYPDPAEEAEIIRRIDAGVYSPAQKLPAAVSLGAVIEAQGLVRRIYIDPAIVRYIVGIAYVTRNAAQYLDPRLASLVDFGASPRASIAFSQAARALALLNGRDHVIPEDVKALAHRILRHRVVLGFDAVVENVRVETVIDAVLASVQAP